MHVDDRPQPQRPTPTPVPTMPPTSVVSRTASAVPAPVPFPPLDYNLNFPGASEIRLSPIPHTPPAGGLGDFPFSPGTLSLSRPPSIPASLLASPIASPHSAASRTSAAGSKGPVSVSSPKLFLAGDPLDVLKSANAPPLPSLLTPAMEALLANRSTTGTAPVGSNEPSTSGASAKKGGRMRVSKTRTARNLYAHTYMKDHPSTTTEEFNAVYKALDAKTLEEYNAMAKFALARSADDTLDTVVNAFNALSDEEQVTYRNVKAKPGRPSKGKGKAKA